MLIFRTLLLLAIFAAVLCVGLYVTTGEHIWRDRAVNIFRWIVLLGLSLIGLMILERLVVRLL